MITIVFVSMLDMYTFNYIRYDGYCSGYVAIKTNQMRKTKGIYSDFAIIRKSATITCVLAETQRPTERGTGMLYSKNWEGFRVA